TACTSTFCWSYAGLNFELGDRIRRRIDSNLPKLTFVIVCAVKREIVARWSRAVNHQHRPAGFTETRGLRGCAHWISAAGFEITATTDYSYNWSRNAGRKCRQQCEVTLRNR